MPKIAFYTLGCKANQYETETMRSQAANNGFKIVDFRSPSDICVVNTCAVTSDACKKGRQAIRQARQRNPRAKIIVAGCYSQVYPEDIIRVGAADAIIGNKEKGEIVKYLMTARPQDHKTARPAAIPAPRIRENLMIQDGCEHFCTYCIVPFARGEVKSKPIEDILREARELVELGAKEIVLTGINLGAYGKDTSRVGRPLRPTIDATLRGLPTRSRPGSTALPRVIEELSKIDGLIRIRLSSLEPMFITEELIDAAAKTPKVCPHLHIPLQSGDDGILKAMGRNYTSKDYLETIEYVKNKIKNAAINTDIIVGFPGETEKAFKNTVKLAEKIKFSRIHVFSFSARKGTAAEKLADKVHGKETRKRYRALDELRAKQMTGFTKKFAGKVVDVLVECRNKKSGLLEGLTPHYIRVLFKGENNLIGKEVRVRIGETAEEFCRGQQVRP